MEPEPELGQGPVVETEDELGSEQRPRRRRGRLALGAGFAIVPFPLARRPSTPAEAAWAEPASQAAVVKLLERGRAGFWRGVVLLELAGERIERSARIDLRLVAVASRRVLEAVDPLTGTVFAGREVRSRRRQLAQRASIQAN